MKPALALLGILSVTFATACELVVLGVYQFRFLEGEKWIDDVARLADVAATLAWWAGVVLIGFAAMVRDRRALQLPSVESRDPTSP